MSLDLRYFSSLSSLLLVIATVAIELPSYGAGAIATDLEISRTQDNFYAQSSPNTLEEAETYYNRGLERNKQGDVDGAIADFSQAIQLNPQNTYQSTAYYNNRGNARAEQGDLEGAIADFSQMIQLNPQDAFAYYNRGVTRADQQDFEGAIADFNRTIEIDPEFSSAYGHRGLAYRNLQRYRDALADLNRAIELGFEEAIPFRDEVLQLLEE